MTYSKKELTEEKVHEQIKWILNSETAAVDFKKGWKGGNCFCWLEKEMPKRVILRIKCLKVTVNITKCNFGFLFDKLTQCTKRSVKECHIFYMSLFNYHLVN